MKKPLRSEFGYSKKTGWQDDRDRDLYDAALLQWYNQPRQMGKARTRPIHPSWEPVLKHFDSSDPIRSQGAFCRWAGVKPATFSNWKHKPLIDDVEKWILEWVWIGDGQGLDGSMNTGKDAKAGMERGRIIYQQYKESGYAVPGLKRKNEVRNG